MESFAFVFFIGSWAQTSGILYDTVELAKISAPQKYHKTLKISVPEEISSIKNIKLGTSGQVDEDTSSAIPLDDDTGPRKRDVIHVHIEESVDTGRLSYMKHGTGFNSVASQWLQDCPDEWYVLKSYDFAAPRSSSSLWEAPKPRRKIGLIFKEMLRDPEKQWAQIMRRITTRREKDGKFQVFISCKTMVRTSRKFLETAKSSKKKQATVPFVLTALFVEELLELESIYCKMRSESNWEKLFLLQFQHANLVVFANFLDVFSNDYVEPRRPDFDPRSSKLRNWVLEEMARDSYQYRQLTNIGNEMTDALESLMDVVKSSLSDNTVSTAQFLSLEPVLRGYCKGMRSRLTRLTDEMESSLRFLELARTMRQTNDVQVLTILAAFFLPLSLAAGVLSMQSRLKDLGVLLYDFFGVVVLLFTFAMAVILILVCWGFLQETASRFMTERLMRPVWIVLGAVTGSGALIFGALIISSFVVGMFKDVVLGAKILGYGCAVAIGGPLAFGFLWGCFRVGYEISKDVVLWVTSRARKTHQKRQKDPEDEPGQIIEDQSASGVRSNAKKSVK